MGLTRRRRQSFERSDVLDLGPQRNRVAVAILVVVAVALAATLVLLWRCARAHGRSGDDGLISSIGSQEVEPVSAEGVMASSDSFTNLLLVTVDDVSSSAPALQKVQILSLDATRRTGVLSVLPLDAALTTSPDVTVRSCFDEGGAAALVPAVATATQVRLDHVIVAADSLWDRLRGLRGSGVTSLLGSGAELLSSLETDMGSSELLGVVEQLQSVGVSRLSQAEAPTTQEEGESGATLTRIDAAGLGLQLGTLVARD